MASSTRNLFIGLLSIGVLSGVSAHAVAADAREQTGNTVADFGWVQAETLRLRALNQLAQEQRINETMEKGDPSIPAAPLEVAPVVARVSGRTANPTAYILLGGGSIVPATEGTRLPGGYTVLSIDARKVEVSKDGQRFALGFATSLPAHRAVSASKGLGNQ